MPVENLTMTVRDLTHFIGMIRTLAETSHNQVMDDDYDERTDRSGTTHRYRFHWGELKILDVSYDYGTKEATFKSRPAVLISFRMFARWASRIEAMLRNGIAGGLLW